MATTISGWAMVATTSPTCTLSPIFNLKFVMMPVPVVTMFTTPPSPITRPSPCAFVGIRATNDQTRTVVTKPRSPARTSHCLALVIVNIRSRSSGDASRSRATLRYMAGFIRLSTPGWAVPVSSRPGSLCSGSSSHGSSRLSGGILRRIDGRQLRKNERIDSLRRLSRIHNCSGRLAYLHQRGCVRQPRGHFIDYRGGQPVLDRQHVDQRVEPQAVFFPLSVQGVLIEPDRLPRLLQLQYGAANTLERHDHR